MSIFTAHHQFEIRYTAILDFPNTIRKTISPFVKFAKRITVDNEASHNERITLSFDDDYYQIFVTWDRMIFRFEGDKENLIKNNSIVEEPFFNVFKRIREHENFGEINNTLYYSFIIIPIDEKGKILDDFLKKYIINYKKIVEQPSDVAVTIDSNINDIQTTLTFGPYFGEEDLKKRNIIVKNPDILKIIDNKGLCCETKMLNLTKSVNFSNYKEACRIEKNFIEKIWAV